MTNSNDSVTLRLMTEHDLAMLYEWLNRSHIVEWWGGEEARPTLADVQEQYLPSVLARVRFTPYIAMLEWSRLGMPSRTLLLESGDGWWKKNRSRSTRNRPVTGECITTGQRLGNQAGSSSAELLFNDPEVTKIQTDPSPSNLGERSDATRKRGLRGKVP